MADLFELKIIEPDGIFFEGESSFLEFTSVDGQRGVYKNHIPTTTILEPCVMKIHRGDEMKKAAIMGGFIEILPDRITVLAEDANWPDEIDMDRAKSAKQRAEQRLKRKEKSVDMRRAEFALKRAVARINAAKK